MRMTHRYRKCSYMWGNINSWGYNVRQFTKQTCMRYVFQMGEKETKFMHILNHKIQRRRDYSIIYRLFQFQHEKAPKSSILDHDIIENKITSFQRNMVSWVVSPVWSLNTHASRPGPMNTDSKGKKKHLESKTQ